MSVRKIIHIDMDAFFASIEQRDNPNYQGQPLVVGYDGPRGVVASASYEAREYGIRSAMPSYLAKRKCPSLIFASSRYDVYKEVSAQIMSIFRQYTDLVEPLSLDEAYLDVTINHKGMLYATDIARDIKYRIREEVGLTASAGVSYNKLLAKIASDYNKPNGLFVIRPEQGASFIQRLRVGALFGVGKTTEKQMNDLGIVAVSDLLPYSLVDLVRMFGKMGYTLYQNARGLDDRLVNPEWDRKSLATETTLSQDIVEMGQAREILCSVSETLSQRLRQTGFLGKTLTLKIKYANFKVITRSSSATIPFVHTDDIFREACRLLSGVDLTPKVRLIGLSVKGADNSCLMEQPLLEFPDYLSPI